MCTVGNKCACVRVCVRVCTVCARACVRCVCVFSIRENTLSRAIQGNGKENRVTRGSAQTQCTFIYNGMYDPKYTL